MGWSARVQGDPGDLEEGLVCAEGRGGGGGGGRGSGGCDGGVMVDGIGVSMHNVGCMAWHPHSNRGRHITT
jgi:hypothetical protein